MTQYVYVNQRAIVCLDDFRPDGANVMEAGEFDLWLNGTKIGRIVYSAAGLDVGKTRVKAWAEFDDLVIVADPKKYVTPPKPVASAKKPNRRVQT